MPQTTPSNSNDADIAEQIALIAKSFNWYEVQELVINALTLIVAEIDPQGLYTKVKPLNHNGYSADLRATIALLENLSFKAKADLAKEYLSKDWEKAPNSSAATLVE